MLTGPATHYTLLDPVFFESLDRYTPTDTYVKMVRDRIGDDWRVQMGGFWTSVAPPNASYRHQGWKIHVSATTDIAQELLALIVPILTRRQIPFKYASDERMLALSLTKTWPRTGAGKFITAYPLDESTFLHTIAECHNVTSHLVGPYILSDRPYPGSRVVFYRYGEHRARPRVDSYGVRAPVLLGPNNETFPDSRVAYFQLPPWVTDPVCKEPPPSPPSDDGILLHGRYNVTGAIKFSSVGGIYQAVDVETGRDVILREARPMLARVNTGYDAERLLEKEARILQRLNGHGLMPEFVDLFKEWEHSFLVQEKLNAESLWGYAMDFAFSEDATPRSMFDGICETAEAIISGLIVIHSHGVILRDMTRTNVLFTEEGAVKFIDLEFAFETYRSDPPVAGWTPGYASPDQIRNELPSFADDYYALGVLLLDMIAFTAPGYTLNREGMLRSLSMDLSDARQPKELRQVVEGLTDPSKYKRWTARKALSAFRAMPLVNDNSPLFPQAVTTLQFPAPSREMISLASETVNGIVQYISGQTTVDRSDRIWPASAEVFYTSPVNLQYGAAGVALFLHRIVGSIRDDVLSWIERRVAERPLPLGLMSGVAGVAELFCGAGMHERALDLLRMPSQQSFEDTLPNVYYGLAGWGLANLKCWAATGEARLLDNAVAAGEHLLRTAQRSERGVFWECDGYIRLGFGEGQSGTATFLVSLFAATSDDRYRHAGVRALEFDLSYAVDAGFGVLWYPHIDAKPGDPKSPHVRFGTAGVGAAALRVFLATRESVFFEWAVRCARTVARRYTNKLWFDYGMAGYTDLLIDMYRFTGDEAYYNAGWYVGERLLLHRMPAGDGYAYLGRDLLRISCDFGMGAAGIGYVLDRLVAPSKGHFFLPDEVLIAESASVVNA